MRAFFLTVFCLLSVTVTTPAPASAELGVAHFETHVAGDATTVWYPLGADRALPVAAVLPGADVKREYYGRFATELAGYGFVVVIPEHYPLPFVDRSLASEYSLTDIAAWAHAQPGDPSSPVRTVIDPETLVAAGHSFGGATALYAAANRCQLPFCFGVSYRHPPELRAIVGHGTNTTIGASVDPVRVNDIPTMLINGTLDGVSEPVEAYDTFTRLTGAPAAAFVRLVGANHFGLIDQNNPPGAVPDLHESTMPRDQSVYAAARWTALWFRAQLGDAEARECIDRAAAGSDPTVTIELR
ncbi:poly(ethylene terephthalate) hydrolase family protein [Nocardia salmonicida]|uniref:poly(ethylene terephthalate) hydrolase family protein n=1 Tax=Nocardia salmonicida TaxID=53431 RepID=UPI0007A378E6|nr:alpha/beta hydrolase [Nocardia salmonicida]